MSAEKSFQAKTALVTGASGGIGAATAVALARQGAHVLMHYNASREGAEETLARVRAEGGDGLLLQADLSTEAGIEDFVRQWRETGRPVDFLVNNAGSLVERAKFLDITLDVWHRVIALNWTSAMRISQAVLPGMIERGSGAIVNLSSVAARNGGGLGASAYASAKAAVGAMTKGMAKEFAPYGIRVNALSPGAIDNHFHRKFSNQQMLNSMIGATPMGRMGTSEECADVIVFLCSDAARFIQGQSLEVNGGMWML